MIEVKHTPQLQVVSCKVAIWFEFEVLVSHGALVFLDTKHIRQDPAANVQVQHIHISKYPLFVSLLKKISLSNLLMSMM